MKPINKFEEHLQKLKNNKRDAELNVRPEDAKFPKNVLDKIKDNFVTRKDMVEKFKEDKKNKVPGAKLGNADRGKVKEKDVKDKEPGKNGDVIENKAIEPNKDKPNK